MGNPAKILIVTNGPLCRNPRPLKEAETLGRAGYDVTVLAIRNHAPSEPVDVALTHGAPFRRETLDMIPGYSAGGGRLLARRSLQWAARRLAGGFGLETVNALGPARPLLQRVRELPADLTIVHNELPHWIGARLLASGRKIAADIEDWHSEDLMPESRRTRPLSLIRAVERSLLHGAAYTTTTSQSLAEGLHARYGGVRPEVITNSFPLQSEPRGDQVDKIDPLPSFFWFSQTLGRGRGIELFLAAWARTARPSRVVLLGESTPGFREFLLSRVPAERRERISFLPLVAPAELPAVISRHDIGLALEQGFIVNRDLTITNKILQYLNAGLAVVASNTAGQREVLGRSPDAGIVVDLGETTELAAALDELLADRGQLARRQAAARRLAEQVYGWEKEAPRLLAIVARALAG